MTPDELRDAAERGQLNETAMALVATRAGALAANDSRAAAAAANDLGVVYYLAGRNREAREALENARDGFVRLEDVTGQAHTLGNLARLEDRSGSWKAAVAMYQQAVDLLHEAGAREDEAATLKLLSQLYLKHGGWLQALAAYDRALIVKPRRGLMDAFLHWFYQIPLRMMGIGA